jgi:hypothetical protein
MSDTIVIYHGPGCPDGWASAWAAHRLLGDDALYVPCNYGDPPPVVPAGSAVYVLDFSFPAAILLDMARRCPTVVVRDHHATARAALEGLHKALPGLDVLFDMGKSGAWLTWEFFFPTEPVPDLIRFTNDRDLWEWQLPQSREINAALAVEPRDFRHWDQLVDRVRLRNGHWHELLVARGEAILAYKQSLIEAVAAGAFLADVGGHEVPVANAPGMLASELGEHLCRQHPDRAFSGSFYRDGTGHEVWSLRSRGGFDVGRVASALGGGGHPAAAGFRRRAGGAHP